MTSRTSVMSYAGSRQALPEIAKELGAEGVVEGSILREGDRVRVTAQLIDARNDAHLWSQSYERELESVLSIQAEIARAIARQIQIEVAPRGDIASDSPARRDPLAIEQYFRGLAERCHFTIAHVRASLALFEEAIRLEPDWAEAHAEKARSHFILGHPLRLDRGSPAREMPSARAAARHALELNDQLGSAHAIIATVRHFFDWDWMALDTPSRGQLHWVQASRGPA